MGLFTKKDPAAEYRKNRQTYLERTAVQNKKEDLYLRPYKTVQKEQIAGLYVKVMRGMLKTGDLLEIEYQPGNRLGVNNVTGKVKAIYQDHSTGGFKKQEVLVETPEAYENDMVWIDVPNVDVKLIYTNGWIRKSKAKNIVAEDSKVDSVAVSYDEEVSKMVNCFKSELYGYFTGGAPIGHITQDLGYALMAQKKRLDRNGITMEIEKSSDIGSAAIRMEVQRYSSSQYDVAEADEPIKLRRTYRRAGQVLYQDDNWRICHYLLAGAKYNQTGLIACPNCGNYAPREALLTGCPYCSTQFEIRDLSLRVAGYAQKQIEQSSGGKIDIGYALYHESKQREYDQVLKHRMVSIDSLFSPTAFYNSMRNKLYSVVFAENETALRNYADASFDIAPYYARFQNVIDIDIQSIDTKNCRRSDPYVLVEVLMDVMVLRLQESGDHAAWTREKVTMSVFKHINNRTKNIFEPGVIQCRCCGGAYSLYEGKACSYCGNEIDYPMYDWLLYGLSIE